MVLLQEKLSALGEVPLAQPLEVGVPKIKPHALVVAGGMGTYRGMHEQERAFNANYNGVTVFNSVISTDAPNRKRFAQMGDVIKTHIKDGVHAVLHSSAVGELSIPLRKMRRSGFFDNPANADNLHITLVSPASTGGAFGPLRYLTRAIRYFREEAEVPLSKKNTLHRGIEALAAFPPTNIPDDIITKGVRSALPELSHYTEEDVQVIPFQDALPNTRYLTEPLFSFDQQIRLVTLDENLKTAIDQQDTTVVRSIIRERGELLRRPLNAIYSGALAENFQAVHESNGSAIGGYIDMARVVGKSMVNAPMREMAKLKALGVQVDEVVPEYDIWRSPEEAKAFNDTHQGQRKNVYMAARTAHASHALQAERFAQTMRTIYDNGLGR